MRLESAAEGAVTAHFAPPASFFIEGFAVAVDPSKLMREEWGENCYPRLEPSTWRECYKL
jgi:hypothetical protein